MARSKSDGYGNYQASADDLDKMIGALPPVLGTWFFADPKSGASGNNGLAPGGAKSNFFDAEALMVDANGDGLVQFSRGNTSADTTSYVTAAKDISKSGSYFKGIDSGNVMYGRARIANDTATLNLAKILTVSGSNNLFEGLHVGNFGSNAAAVGCLEVTGHRNHFKSCHFIGAGHATPAAVATAFDVKVNGAQETFFEDCVFGTDTIIRAAANANLVFDGGAWRTRFKNCIFISYSATAGHGMISLADADAISGFQMFENCKFLNWTPNGLTELTSVVIGTKATSGQLYFDNKSEYAGFGAWGAAGMSGCIYTGSVAPTASAGGGKAVTI